MENRPRGREKHVTGQGKDIYRRGEGLGTGPVGNAGGYAGRPGKSGSTPSGTGAKRSVRSGKSGILIALAVLLLGGGGAGLSGIFGGSSGSTENYSSYTQQPSSSYSSAAEQIGSLIGGNSAASSGSLSELLSGFSGSNVSTGWTDSSENETLDTSVASGARAKYTKILGNGQDTVTIMVYMCGTDLESQGGMATSDLSEMTKATIGSNVNLIVMTGGCKRWNNNIVSNKVNQIYKIEDGGLLCLSKDCGSDAMTLPATLSSFIQFCKTNYPANRNALIFWDHGGGSLSGYGYDEKHSGSGSMTLKGINQALKDGGMKFDFIGFDACLMATAENALMLADYADYMIASEETEPGVGWYYTNWLTELSGNTAKPTVEIGRKIVDDFVTVCGQTCRGQKTTLSVVDLAELEATLPEKLAAFSVSTYEMVQGSDYKTVANARSSAREFSSENRIDQVDLTSFALNLDTKDAKALAECITSAVKYNRTSSNMTNAYGLSIYFPYKKMSAVSSAVSTYDAIGMDGDYSKCIQAFASMQAGGQAVSGGYASPLQSLLGSYSSGGSYTSSGSAYGSGAMGADMVSQLLMGMLGGNMGGVSGLTGSNSSFFGKGLDMDRAAQYLTENQFDASNLVWTRDAAGTVCMPLTEQQWSLVQDLELNVFFDDGKGYIDLGLDNVFDFTDDAALKGEYDGTWLAINDQPVAYYHVDTVDDGENYCITGRVPVMLNGERAELILVFDNEHPYGYVAGARREYHNGETETIAKSLIELHEGDVIDFICDYYGYDGTYQDSYYLGEKMTVSGELSISNVYIDASKAQPTYRFTDIYQQQYWTPVLP